MKPLKICLISTMIFPSPPTGYGGLEGVLFDEAVELLKLGHIVTVVAPKGSDIPGAELIMPCDPSFANPEGEAFMQYQARLNEFDIVHDHSWAGFPYVWKLQNPDLKLIHSIHSMQPWNQPPPIKFPCLAGASKYHAELISSWSGCHCEYIYHGIDLDTYKFSDRKEDYLLYCARVVPFKGAHEFVALCYRLGMRGVLVGEDIYIDQEHQPYARRVMDSCDGDQVVYYGRVPRGSDLMIELMQNAKAVISPLLPPYGEIFGLTTVEAMACGTPFISTDQGAAKELIVQGKTGFVVPTVADIDDAVHKLDKIDPQDCRKKAEEFDRKIMAENYAKLFEKMLNGYMW